MKKTLSTKGVPAPVRGAYNLTCGIDERRFHWADGWQRKMNRHLDAFWKDRGINPKEVFHDNPVV